MRLFSPQDEPFKQAAFSVPQAAARCGVSNRHVYDLCARGELGHLRIGSLIRIRLEDLEAYAVRQWHGPSSPPQTTASPSAATASMSAGGRTMPTSAFQRGKQNAAQHRSG